MSVCDMKWQSLGTGQVRFVQCRSFMKLLTSDGFSRIVTHCWRRVVSAWPRSKVLTGIDQSATEPSELCGKYPEFHILLSLLLARLLHRNTGTVTYLPSVPVYVWSVVLRFINGPLFFMSLSCQITVDHDWHKDNRNWCNEHWTPSNICHVSLCVIPLIYNINLRSCGNSQESVSKKCHRERWKTLLQCRTCEVVQGVSENMSLLQ